MKIVVIAMQCNFNEGDKLDAHRPLPITVKSPKKSLIFLRISGLASKKRSNKKKEKYVLDQRMHDDISKYVVKKLIQTSAKIS